MDARRKVWLEKVYRRSHSINSRHAVEMALGAFDRATGEPVESTVGKVKNGQLDVYEVIDRFVDSLDKAGLSPHTISGYVNRVMRYLAYSDVPLDNIKFRAKVVLPRLEEPDDRAPTVEEIRRILSWGKLRTKTLILVLASSGMRGGEAIKLKTRDLNLNSRPARIVLSPKVASKTGEGRTVYVSDEAVDYLKQYLRKRAEDGESWVFPSEANETQHMSEDRAWRTIVDCIEKAGLGKSKESTVYRRRKIHPHSFRKFFFSKVVGIISDTAAHALMGHGAYLKTYYRRTEEERAQDYLRCMPSLTILKDSPEMEKVKKDAVLEAMRAFAQAYGVDPNRVRIERQKETGKEPTTDEEILGIQNEIKKLRSENTDQKKIISENDLQQHLAEGWDIQTVLPSGKIVINRKESNGRF